MCADIVAAFADAFNEMLNIDLTSVSKTYFGLFIFNLSDLLEKTTVSLPVTKRLLQLLTKENQQLWNNVRKGIYDKAHSH